MPVCVKLLRIFLVLPVVFNGRCDHLSFSVDFLTSFKGPTMRSIPSRPQLIPHQPTFDNYVRVWNLLPVAGFFGIVSLWQSSRWF